MNKIMISLPSWFPATLHNQPSFLVSYNTPMREPPSSPMIHYAFLFLVVILVDSNAIFAFGKYLDFPVRNDRNLSLKEFISILLTETRTKFLGATERTEPDKMTEHLVRIYRARG